MPFSLKHHFLFSFFGCTFIWRNSGSLLRSSLPRAGSSLQYANSSSLTRIKLGLKRTTRKAPSIISGGDERLWRFMSPACVPPTGCLQRGSLNHTTVSRLHPGSILSSSQMTAQGGPPRSGVCTMAIHPLLGYRAVISTRVRDPVTTTTGKMAALPAPRSSEALRAGHSLPWAPLTRLCLHACSF